MTDEEAEWLAQARRDWTRTGQLAVDTFIALNHLGLDPQEVAERLAEEYKEK